MRTAALPIVMVTCLLGSGCSFVTMIGRNIVNEPRLHCDEKIIRKRHERVAKAAWNEMVKQYGDQFSCDYRDGFVEGFADYLNYGGPQDGTEGDNTIIPAVPPPRYRRAKDMSPQGFQATENWYMGFRHGSATALASGLRTMMLVPVFDRPNVYGSQSASDLFMSNPNSNVSGPQAPATAPDQLPAPRKVVDPDKTAPSAEPGPARTPELPPPAGPGRANPVPARPSVPVGPPVPER